MAHFGKSIRIYLKDGTVSGIRIAEIVNQTIQAIACPRNRMSELKSYQEANKPGVYFLFGEDSESGTMKAYIGEAENVFERLQSHLLKKEFWSEVIFFISKDENLTKSHVRFLESNAIRLALSTSRYIIENGNQSQPSSLPAADKDAMQEFIGYIKILLGIFSHKLLEELTPIKLEQTRLQSSVSEPEPTYEVSDSSKFLELFLTISGLKASALQTDEGVVVLPGSEAALEVMSSLSMGYRTLRQKLINNGVMHLVESKYIFKQKYLFDSPTPAAAVIVGYNISGPQNWKNINGKSLKDIEAEKINN